MAAGERVIEAGRAQCKSVSCRSDLESPAAASLQSKARRPNRGELGAQRTYDEDRRGFEAVGLPACGPAVRRATSCERQKRAQMGQDRQRDRFKAGHERQSPLLSRALRSRERLENQAGTDGEVRHDWLVGWLAGGSGWAWQGEVGRVESVGEAGGWDRIIDIWPSVACCRSVALALCLLTCEGQSRSDGRSDGRSRVGLAADHPPAPAGKAPAEARPARTGQQGRFFCAGSTCRRRPLSRSGRRGHRRRHMAREKESEKAYEDGYEIARESETKKPGDQALRESCCMLTSSAYPPLSASSSWCVPLSATRPSRKKKIWSAFWIVESCKRRRRRRRRGSQR